MAPLAVLLALQSAGWLLPARTPCLTPAPTAAPLRAALTLQADSFGVEFAYISEDTDDEYPDEDDADSMDLGFAKEPEVPLPNMTVAMLQAELKLLGLKSSGRKADLIERIEMAQRKKKAGVPVHSLEVHQDKDLKWYMVQTANGFEKTVSQTIMQAVEVQGLRKDLDDVFARPQCR